MSGAGAAYASYYRPAQVAEMLHCSEWWVKEQARKRRIPYCWIGGSYLFTEDHIAAIIRLFEVQPEQSGTVVGISRTSRADTVSDLSGPGRLRARPPRRSRETRSTSDAA